MLNIFALRQRNVELVSQNQKLLDRSKGRDLDAAETAEFNATMVLIAKNKVAMEECEVALDTERKSRSGLEVRGDGVERRPTSAINRTRSRIGARYAELWGLEHGLSRDGFDGINDFLGTIHSGLADNRLRSGIQAAAGEQREVSPTSGGFMVPSEFAQGILDNSLESEVVRPRAMIWPMTTNSRKVPGIDGFSHANNVLMGGITSAFVNEPDTLALQQVKLWLLELVAKKMGLLIQASNELLADSDFDSVIGAKLMEACSWEMDQAFLFGGGAGVPRGIFNDPALIVVAKDASQPTATISYNNICNMFARLYPAGRRNAVWVATSDCLPQLLQLSLRFLNIAGTDYIGGSSFPVFTKSAADGTWELLGRPLILSEKLQPLGTQGDLLLADFSQYAIGMRRELVLERSWHAGFTTDSLFYRLIARVDGVGTWKTALQPPNSENTLSPFVTLAARP
jgi:HK97 family phage major capsid protein